MNFSHWFWYKSRTNLCVSYKPVNCCFDRIYHHSHSLSVIKLTRHLYLLPLFEDKSFSIITNTLFLIVRVSLSFSRVTNHSDDNACMNRRKYFYLKIFLFFIIPKIKIFLSQYLMPLFITIHFLDDILNKLKILYMLVWKNFKIKINFFSKSTQILTQNDMIFS